MIVSDSVRLWLYVLMGVFPIWQDFFIKSTDYSFRGLAMPILSSLSTATAIALAKTSTKKDAPVDPLEVVAPPGKPLKTQETPATPETKPVKPKKKP